MNSRMGFLFGSAPTQVEPRDTQIPLNGTEVIEFIGLEGAEFMGLEAIESMSLEAI